MYKQIVLVFTSFLISFTACAGDFTLITVGCIEGAIIPDNEAPRDIQTMLGIEVQDYWTPGIADITKFEDFLRALFDNSPPSFIQEHYYEYRRQYIGLMIEGRKVIYVNSFRKSEDDRYARAVVSFEGGMCWYWYTLFWIDGQESFTLHFNGEL